MFDVMLDGWREGVKSSSALLQDMVEAERAAKSGKKGKAKKGKKGKKAKKGKDAKGKGKKKKDPTVSAAYI